MLQRAKEKPTKFSVRTPHGHLINVQVRGVSKGGRAAPPFYVRGKRGTQAWEQGYPCDIPVIRTKLDPPCSPAKPNSNAVLGRRGGTEGGYHPMDANSMAVSGWPQVESGALVGYFCPPYIVGILCMNGLRNQSC